MRLFLARSASPLPENEKKKNSANYDRRRINADLLQYLSGVNQMRLII